MNNDKDLERCEYKLKEAFQTLKDTQILDSLKKQSQSHILYEEKQTDLV